MARVEERKPILIIEDEDVVLESFDFILSNEYNLTIVKNGKEGLEEALKNNKKGVILDLSLPGINGLELLAEYNRQTSEKDRIPFIIVTALGDIYKTKTIEMGVKDYITKPFKFNEVYNSVKKHFH